jgi:methionyl-tRNA formyltransferase
VTIHEVDAGIDTGPILVQSAFPIDPDVDEVEDVYARCLVSAERLWRTLADDIDLIVAHPQDETLASYYSARDIPKLGDRSGWRR